MFIESNRLQDIVRQAIAEDLPFGDRTTEALFPQAREANGTLVAKEALVPAGMAVAREVFSEVDRSLLFEPLCTEGVRVGPGTAVARVRGDARGILKGERVALNFLQHLSGIATLTARYVEAVSGLPVQIVDTRKTLPGLRGLEKEAVRLGGGFNHRSHLGEMIFIKDNHIALAGGVKAALTSARHQSGSTSLIEVEIDDPGVLEEALSVGADWILLDNMTPVELTEAVRLIRRTSPGTRIEASGGVRLENVRAIAATGVDRISVGALTHSAPSVDISLEVDPS